MALSKIQRAGMYAAAFATAITGGVNISSQDHSVSFATAAHAESACLPGVYSPSRPVQPGDCFTMAEFNKAMVAEKQQPILVGNRDTGIYKYGEYFTSNSDGSKGVNAEMDVSYEQKAQASTVTISAVYTDIKVNNVNASAAVPQWPELKGDNAKARQYCHSFNGACITFPDYMARNGLGGVRKTDARVMFVAQTLHSPTADGNWREGQKIIVFRDMNDGEGDVATLNEAGATTPLFSMLPVSYTQFANRFMPDRRASNDTKPTTSVAALALNN